jgi:hypothetical protein
MLNVAVGEMVAKTRTHTDGERYGLGDEHWWRWEENGCIGKFAAFRFD